MNAAHTAHADQWAAAADEALLTLDAQTTAAGLPGPVWQPAGPVARRLLTELGATPRRCAHLRGGPRLTWLLGWRPGWLWCSRCATGELLRVRGTVEDRTCDGCGQTDAPLTALGAAYGQLLLRLGLCEACLAGERGAP